MSQRKLTKFGLYMSLVRQRKFRTQEDLAKSLKDRGRPASQSLIAQIETGRITNPDEEFLRNISEILEEPYEEIIRQLVLDKFACDLKDLREESKIDLKSLIGKKVRYSLLNWELNKFLPISFIAIVAGIDGTMVLMRFQETYPGRGPVKDTWINTSSQLMVFIQEV